METHNTEYKDGPTDLTCSHPEGFEHNRGPVDLTTSYLDNNTSRRVEYCMNWNWKGFAVSLALHAAVMGVIAGNPTSQIRSNTKATFSTQEKAEADNSAEIQALKQAKAIFVERSIDQYLDPHHSDYLGENALPPAEIYFELSSYEHAIAYAEGMNRKVTRLELEEVRQRHINHYLKRFEQAVQGVLNNAELAWTGDVLQDLNLISQALFVGENRFYWHPGESSTKYRKDVDELHINLTTGRVNCQSSRTTRLLLEEVYEAKGFPKDNLQKIKALAWEDHVSTAYVQDDETFQLQDLGFEGPKKTLESSFTNVEGVVRPIQHHLAISLFFRGANEDQKLKIQDLGYMSKTNGRFMDKPIDLLSPLNANNTETEKLPAEVPSKEAVVNSSIEEFLINWRTGSRNQNSSIYETPEWIHNPRFVELAMNQNISEGTASKFYNDLLLFGTAEQRAAYRAKLLGSVVVKGHLADFYSEDESRLRWAVYPLALAVNSASTSPIDMVLLNAAEADPRFSSQWTKGVQAYLRLEKAKHGSVSPQRAITLSKATSYLEQERGHDVDSDALDAEIIRLMQEQSDLEYFHPIFLKPISELDKMSDEEFIQIVEEILENPLAKKPYWSPLHTLRDNKRFLKSFFTKVHTQNPDLAHELFVLGVNNRDIKISTAIPLLENLLQMGGAEEGIEKRSVDSVIQEILVDSSINGEQLEELLRPYTNIYERSPDSIREYFTINRDKYNPESLFYLGFHEIVYGHKFKGGIDLREVSYGYHSVLLSGSEALRAHPSHAFRVYFLDLYTAASSAEQRFTLLEHGVLLKALPRKGALHPEDLDRIAQVDWFEIPIGQGEVWSNELPNKYILKVHYFPESLGVDEVVHLRSKGHLYLPSQPEDIFSEKTGPRKVHRTINLCHLLEEDLQTGLDALEKLIED